MAESALAISTLFRAADVLARRAAQREDAPNSPGLAARRRLRELIQGVRGLLDYATGLDDALGGAAPGPAPAPWGVPPAGPTAAGPRPALVEVCAGVAVHAMVLPGACRTVAEVTAAISGPMLCYVPAWGHFAVRLGDHLLHGNVGRVYPPSVRHPQGVKECSSARCRESAAAAAACTYYHDPAAAPGRGEPARAAAAPLAVRSFFAESFAYSPRAGPQCSRYGRRCLGDSAALREDVQALSAREARLFLSQVAHDLVCAAVLLQARPDACAK